MDGYSMPPYYAYSTTDGWQIVRTGDLHSNYGVHLSGRDHSPVDGWTQPQIDLLVQMLNNAHEKVRLSR